MLFALAHDEDAGAAVGPGCPTVCSMQTTLSGRRRTRSTSLRTWRPAVAALTTSMEFELLPASELAPPVRAQGPGDAARAPELGRPPAWPLRPLLRGAVAAVRGRRSPRAMAPTSKTAGGGPSLCGPVLLGRPP